MTKAAITGVTSHPGAVCWSVGLVDIPSAAGSLIRHAAVLPQESTDVCNIGRLESAVFVTVISSPLSSTTRWGKLTP